MNTGIVTAIVLAVLLSLWTMLDNRTRKQSVTIDQESFGDTAFRPAKWVFWIMVAFLTMVVFLIVGSLILTPTKDMVLLLSIVLGLMSLLGILGIVSYYRTQLIFEGDAVIYKGTYFDTTFHMQKIVKWQGLDMEMSIPLSKIRSVCVANLYISIDVGEKRRRAIPNIFEDSGRILAMLQRYRPKNHDYIRAVQQGS